LNAALEFIRLYEARVIVETVVFVVALQPQCGRLVGNPALVERCQFALAPHERETFFRFAQRQQHAHQGLVERGVLRLRIARGARLGRGLGEAALLVQHDCEGGGDLRYESLGSQHVAQDALRRDCIAGLAQDLAMGHAQPHIARPRLLAAQEFAGKVAIAAHVTELRERDLCLEVCRVGCERSKIGLLGLVEPRKIGERAAAVECDLAPAEPGTSRTIELGEGLLGALLLTQQRAEIVTRGGIARRDLERLAIGSLGLAMPALATQRDTERAPGLGVAGVGGQQLLRLAGRGGMQRGIVQQPGESQARRAHLGRDLERHPVTQLRIGNATTAAQQVTQVGVVFSAVRRGLDARAHQALRLVEVARMLAHQAEQLQRVGIARCRGEQGAASRFGRLQLAAAHQVMGSRQLMIPVHPRKSSTRQPAGDDRLAGKKNGGLAPAVQCSRERLRFCQNL
jgi:hypothetical protein